MKDIENLYELIEHVDAPSIKEQLKEVAASLNETLEENDTEIGNQKDHLSELKEEINALEIKKANEINDLEEQVNSLIGLESFVSETPVDEMKNKVLADLSKNLSLEQLENLEKQAVALLKSSGKEYFSMERVL